MIVYHGSSAEVKTPDIFHSRDSVDFEKLQMCIRNQEILGQHFRFVESEEI